MHENDINSQSHTRATRSNIKMDQVLGLYHTVENNLSPVIAVDVIKRAISQDKLYCFGELYEKLSAKVNTTRELGEDANVLAWMKVLEVFTYGTWSDYIGMGDRVALDDKQTKKLKQLSLASLAAESKQLKYDVIGQQLQIEKPDLEAFLVDSIYDRVVVGKLDTKRQFLEITNVVGRDVNGRRLDEMETILNQWVSRTEDILESSMTHVDEYKKSVATRKKELNEYTATVDKINEKLKSASQNSQASHRLPQEPVAENAMFR